VVQGPPIQARGVLAVHQGKSIGSWNMTTGHSSTSHRTALGKLALVLVLVLAACAPRGQPRDRPHPRRHECGVRRGAGRFPSAGSVARPPRFVAWPRAARAWSRRRPCRPAGANRCRRSRCGRAVPRAGPLAVPRPGAGAHLHRSCFDRGHPGRRRRPSSTLSTATSESESEGLGYLFTGTRSVLIGVAMLHLSLFEAWPGWPRHHRAIPGRRVIRVRRTLRGARLDVRGHDRTDHLHRLVGLAHRFGFRPSARVGSASTVDQQAWLRTTPSR
jgi:hypothetical protein